MKTLKKFAALVALSIAAMGVLAPAAQAAPQASQTQLAQPNAWEWT